MAKNLSWTKTNSPHISVLETLTGTPYRQWFFYRNGVPGRSGLLSPLLMRQKHCWNYFVFNQLYLVKGKIAPVVLLPHEAKQIYMILHWRIRTGSDWWFSKILRISYGSDSILSSHDWTRTEKFHSPLISGGWRAAHWTWLRKRACWRAALFYSLPCPFPQLALFCSPPAPPSVFCAARQKFTFFIWKHGLPARPALQLVLPVTWQVGYDTQQGLRFEIEVCVRFSLQFTHCRQEQVLLKACLHWHDDRTRPLNWAVTDVMVN